MGSGSWWLCLCTLGILAAPCRGTRPCLNRITINVILLDDEESPWSLQYVEGQIQKAIEKDSAINAAQDVGFNLTANFRGFDTTLYWRRGCPSSSCEGVGEINNLMDSGTMGCAVLGPTCTYAAFPIVDTEAGMSLSTPIFSAGSFGPSCDYTFNLLRLLPPARKISDFFTHFWKEKNNLKPAWKTAYIYKKQSSSEECFWYINAMEANQALFASKMMLRSPTELHNVLTLPNRTSNSQYIIMYNITGRGEHAELLMRPLLIPLHSDVYYTNTSLHPEMKNVLVLTMPNTRNYTINPNLKDNNTMNDYMAAYHDSVLFIGQVMRKIAEINHSELQEMEFVNTNYFRNASFDGIAGNYKLDKYGDRDVNFSVIYTTADNKVPCPPLASFLTFSSEYMKKNKLSLNVKSYCAYFAFDLVLKCVFFFPLIQNRRDRLLRKRWSHINTDLITLLEDVSVISLNVSEICNLVGASAIYIFFSQIVILKELKNSDGNFDKTQKRELNALLHIDYYNLTKFYGTVKLDQGVFGVFEYGERGSLRCVLNDKISYPEETFMDWEFKISVMYDIAKGMSYLHASDIQVHGRLKSTNCVVDNRMLVKITDFGCNAFLSPGQDLWTAPEHLRNQGTSQKGDVYSFAIIAQEIVLRKNTFFTESCSNRSEKLSRVISSYFRPDLNFDTASEKELEVYMLIKNCWDEDPEKRPDFKKVENCLGKIISKIHNQENESYLDNMIRRLQMYSRNLEYLVEERTALYKAERDRADYLNFMLLPGPVVKSLKETGVVEPELYDEVTIYFSDIVGFTTLCQYSTPIEVVDMLNDIYKGFDSIVDHHDVYKVETIGDAYMVASGLPKRNGNRHAVDICRMALDILSFMGTFQLRHLPGIPVWIRIGVHSGPCAAGVVGIKMPRYCLFGDTVNTTSRMESTGHPLRIHVSQSTIDILQRTNCRFEYEMRGETYLKGQSTETTYWLTGETGEDYDLPVPPTTENVQRLQQDLAHMILTCLERRSRGSVRRKKLLSSQSKEDSSDQGSEVESESSLPEYLHLATVDNTLSTFL
uniref:Guanylate cyclase n=1 Tax=Amphilophus citrinellus TaxID=61819 RepID=A0A3Q0T790_AMPCI